MTKFANFIVQLFLNISFLFRPEFWTQIKPYSSAWDEMLNLMLDDPHFQDNQSSHTVILNGKCIWISNWPYAYATPYAWAEEVLPRRQTRVRFRKAYEAYAFKKTSDICSKQK